MRHFLFFYLLAAMAFLLTACSMQSPTADQSAVDANTERVSNNATQSGVSKEPDELSAKGEESKVEKPETDAQEPVPDGTENPVSTDVPSTETQPKKPEPSTETDAPVAEEPPVEEPAQMPTLMLSIDGTPVTVLWEDNETVSELLTAAQNGAIEVSASRYGGFEQVGSLPQSFSRSDVQMTTQPGDIVLYSGNQLVIFFGSNSWSYTRLGHVNGMSSEELSDLLNKDVVMIELSAE